MGEKDNIDIPFCVSKLYCIHRTTVKMYEVNVWSKLAWMNLTNIGLKEKTMYEDACSVIYSVLLY